MLTRRRFLGYSALAPALLRYLSPRRSSAAEMPDGSDSLLLRLAVIGTEYRYGSQLQTIVDRFLIGYPENGTWHRPNVRVVSLYLDPKPRWFGSTSFGSIDAARARLAHFRAARNQRLQGVSSPSPVSEQSQEDDLSAARAEEFGFTIYQNIPAALRRGGDHLACDAVLAVVEQGSYPRNDLGQILYPNYDFFEQCARVFKAEGRGVPYYNHKNLSFSFREAQEMLATSERLHFPMLAGSSLPVTWRLPDVDMPLGAEIQEAVMVGVERSDFTDFDALEAMQCMLERRKGGETGVQAVQLIEGDAVWEAGNAGRWSKELLSSALSRSDTPLGLTLLDGRNQDLVGTGVLPQLVKDPAAYFVEYRDGTRATLLMLTGAVEDFNFSARVAGQGLVSTQFFLSPVPNETYSACLVSKIEQMFMTQNAPYSARRTLLTSGILEACLTSKAQLHQRLQTPHLAVSYQPPAESQYART